MCYRLSAIVLACALAAPAAAQQPAPWKPKNLKFFPQDITREALTQRMREFSFALNVRCQYCHAGGDGVSFEGVDFSSDEKTAKLKARAMLRLTQEVNQTLLPKIPSRAEPRVEVNCATCHHGRRLPKSLQTTLFEIVELDGAAAAVAKYKELRADMSMGLYNFGQWEIMELARRLVEAKNPAAAITMLEMNGEYYPKSAAIDFQIGELQLGLGDKAKALQRYKAALQKEPQNPAIRARIAELEKQ
jgi:tetratricopeptide (TPR) repeat protein